jgi:hypothetical protein
MVALDQGRTDLQWLDYEPRDDPNQRVSISMNGIQKRG